MGAYKGRGLGGGEAATKPPPKTLKHCLSERNKVERRISMFVTRLFQTVVLLNILCFK